MRRSGCGRREKYWRTVQVADVSRVEHLVRPGITKGEC